MRPVSLSARRAWIEIDKYNIVHNGQRSLSARRAWIEIRRHPTMKKFELVALRKESVDRNAGIITSTGLFRVALRKESVDRNP